MKTTDKNFIEETRKQIAPVLEEVLSGSKTAESAAAAIYMTLDDKTELIASMMTESMVGLIENYHAEVEACRKDAKAYIEQQLQEKLQAVKEPLDRCKVYHRILVALASYDLYIQGREKEAEEFEERNRILDCTAEQAVEKEKELHDLAVEAIRKSPFCAAQIPDLINELSQKECEGLKATVRFGRESKDLKLLLAMQAYVNAQKHCYEDLSDAASMEQIVRTVCAAVDISAVASQVGEGTMQEEEAYSLVETIGRVAGFGALLFVAYSGAAFMAGLLFTLLPLNLFLSIVLGALIAYWAFSDPDIANGFVNVGGKIAVSLGAIVTTGTGLIIKGLKSLAQWAAPRIKSAYEWLKGKISDLAAAFKERHNEVKTPAEQPQAAAEVDPVPQSESLVQPSQDVQPQMANA